MGLNDRLSSARPASDRRASELAAPAPRETQAYEDRRRPNERVFQAPVTSVRAVMGPPEERCWVERQQVSEPERGDPSVGRGVLGAVIGGVIGHQIGGGRGRDLATVGGAVAGAAIGANSGRDREVTRMRDVRRCDTAGKQVPAYWDVGYKFRGVPHQIQMASAPGRTVEVNDRGEPRQ